MLERAWLVRTHTPAHPCNLMILLGETPIVFQHVWSLELFMILPPCLSLVCLGISPRHKIQDISPSSCLYPPT